MNMATAQQPPCQDASPAEKLKNALDECMVESFPAAVPVAIAIEHPEKDSEGHKLMPHLFAAVSFIPPPAVSLENHHEQVLSP